MYAPPVYSLNKAAALTPGGGAIIDIGDIDQPLIPPIMHGTMTGTATVQVLGSHDAVNWVDYSSGGLTANFAKSLVLGVRFWQASVTSYGSGTITASVGYVPTASGKPIMPHLLAVDNNATLGQ
jgi:hypothetical protein